MTIKPLSLPSLFSKGPQRGSKPPVKAILSGSLLSKRQIVQHPNTKQEKVVDEHVVTRPVQGKEGEDGYVILQQGLTIPGPPKSFYAARIDIGLVLPTRTSTDDEIRESYNRADILIDEQMVAHVDEAKAALGIE